MSASCKKWFAILLAVWLPLFSGSALAASVAMQWPHAASHPACHAMAMDDGDAAAHHDHAAGDPQPPPACNACGVCHLACTAYLATAAVAAPTHQTTPAPATPYRVDFRSTSFPPLLPPPLARA